MNKYIVDARDTFISIYKNINILEKNDLYVNNKVLLLFVNLFFHFPIKYILKYSKINYLYKIDSLYFYENYSPISNNIYPMMLTFKILSKSKLYNNEKTILLDDLDLLDRIKLYNMNVPFKIFLLNENININNYNEIIVKTLKSRRNIIYNINDCINYNLSDFVI
jgi:hypothetical protein